MWVDPVGAYGQVWKCLDKETGQMIAMKRFKEVRSCVGIGPSS